MHSTQIDLTSVDCGGGHPFDRNYSREWCVHHNGDYSGEVIIDLVPGNYFEGPGQDVRIPFVLLVELVGQYLNNQMMTKLQDMDGRDTIASLLVPTD